MIHPLMDHNVRRLLPGDIDHIATHMRRIDQREVMAYGHPSPIEALERSIALSSECWTAITDKGTPTALFGVGRVPQSLYDVAFMPAWFLATNDLYDRPNAIRFLRHSQAWALWLLERYGPIGNEVWDQHPRSLHWLSWLGFEETGRRKVGRATFICLVKDH